MHVHISLCYDTFNSFRKIPGKEIAESNGTSSPSFLSNLTLISTAVAPIYTPTSSGEVFLSSYIPASMCYLLIFWYSHYFWSEIESQLFKICIFQMTSNAEHFFIYLFAISTSSSEKCLFISDAHFWTGILN